MSGEPAGVRSLKVVIIERGDVLSDTDVMVDDLSLSRSGITDRNWVLVTAAA